MTSTSEVLNRAADLIEERGWGQGAHTWGRPQDDGALCLEGGIIAAAGLTNLFDGGRGLYEGCPAFEAVANYLGCDPRPKPLGRRSGRSYVWKWNDTASRTAAEVIEVLRATAVIEAARENADAPVEVAS